MDKAKKEKFIIKKSLKIPLVYLAISLLLMVLPVQTTINSVRALLSYIFIPQIRIAYEGKEYLEQVSDGMKTLLNIAIENATLKEQIKELKLENSNQKILKSENERLKRIIELSNISFNGVWTQIIYKDILRNTTLIVNKGSKDNIVLGSAVLALDEENTLVLCGLVIEVYEDTCKVMLVNDDDFNVYAYLENTKTEGLVVGEGFKGVFIKYIPIEEDVAVGQKILTSSASALFPEGILIGYVESDGKKELTSASSYKMPKIKLAIQPSQIKELFILISKEQNNV